MYKEYIVHLKSFSSDIYTIIINTDDVSKISMGNPMFVDYLKSTYPFEVSDNTICLDIEMVSDREKIKTITI